VYDSPLRTFSCHEWESNQRGRPPANIHARKQVFKTAPEFRDGRRNKAVYFPDTVLQEESLVPSAPLTHSRDFVSLQDGWSTPHFNSPSFRLCTTRHLVHRPPIGGESITGDAPSPRQGIPPSSRASWSYHSKKRSLRPPSDSPPPPALATNPSTSRVVEEGSVGVGLAV